MRSSSVLESNRVTSGLSHMSRSVTTDFVTCSSRQYYRLRPSPPEAREARTFESLLTDADLVEGTSLAQPMRIVNIRRSFWTHAWKSSQPFPKFLRSRSAWGSSWPVNTPHRTTWHCHRPLPPGTLLLSSLLPIQATADRPSIWLVLSLLTGLPLALWTYKV